MESSRECVCCKEIIKMVEKIDEVEGPVLCTCITQHSGFEAVCLNVWVLQTAYYQYRQHYGSVSTELTTLHE